MQSSRSVTGHPAPPCLSVRPQACSWTSESPASSRTASCAARTLETNLSSGVVASALPDGPGRSRPIPASQMGNEFLAVSVAKSHCTCLPAVKSEPWRTASARATAADGKRTSFATLARVDDPVDVRARPPRGILQKVLRGADPCELGAQGHPLTSLPTSYGRCPQATC